MTLLAGFPEAACTRALASTNEDASRALDWLLANPLDAANAAAGHPARPVIHSMGFEETMVQLALAQADGNEELAINLLLNGEVRPTAPAPASSAAASDGRAIFSMGFDAALVRRALRQANDREEVAVEILLTGSVADRDEVRRFGTAPSSWHGTREEHEAAMECSMEAYLLQVTPAFSSTTLLTHHCRWCGSSLSGGVRPNLQHHQEWLQSQLSSCRPAFDLEHPDAAYDAAQHAQYMISTFRSRHPGIRLRRGSQFTLRIARDRVVDSTVDHLAGVADDDMPDANDIKVEFEDQEGYDAGGLTDDWLSMFMLEAMNPFREPPLFLFPRQIDGLAEASCLRLNHSLHAFGMTAERERALMRTFGFVLAVCLKRGRYACNKYMLSKSLLQRLLGQDLPEGLLGLKEEFPEEYQVRLSPPTIQMCFHHHRHLLPAF